MFHNNFQEADLSNANFEGVDMFNDQVYTETIKNKADLADLPGTEIAKELFEEFDQFYIISTAVNGDDLQISFIVFTVFVDTNLENANFKNADLKFTNFFQADLINANLSGADLRKVNLEGANLEGANLESANLEGANLKCLNHPICLND